MTILSRFRLVPHQGENDASVILRSGSDEESHATITSGLHSRDSSLPQPALSVAEGVAQNDVHQNQLGKVLVHKMARAPVIRRNLFELWVYVVADLHYLGAA